MQLVKISERAIQKLNLKAETHPKPYKLAWLANSSNVCLTKMCLVRFSIHNLKDEAWCDVVPMDACHTLLGRHWQFDRKVKWNGLTNIYSLWLNNWKFNPLTQPFGLSHNNKPVCLCMTDFEADLEDAEVCYVIWLQAC